ncbi:unnamed protein product, partial [Urochloa humidicola]
SLYTQAKQRRRQCECERVAAVAGAAGVGRLRRRQEGPARALAAARGAYADSTVRKEPCRGGPHTWRLVCGATTYEWRSELAAGCCDNTAAGEPVAVPARQLGWPGLR